MNRQERNKIETKIKEAYETAEENNRKLNLAKESIKHYTEQNRMLMGYIQAYEELLGKRKMQKTQPDPKKLQKLRDKAAVMVPKTAEESTDDPS